MLNILNRYGKNHFDKRKKQPQYPTDNAGKTSSAVASTCLVPLNDSRKTILKNYKVLSNPQKKVLHGKKR